MRGGNRAAFNTLSGICAGLLLAACSTPPPSESPRVDSQAPRPIAAPEHAASVSYPRNGDSDDFVCHHGAPADPRTLQACQRLRPPPEP